MIRTYPCPSDETCWADECIQAQQCMHTNEVTIFVCPSSCDHVMDKEVDITTEHSTITTRACNKCGLTSFDLSLLELP